ncbi:hypothetical protein EST38_g5929 [Candolleomyces aberdarensis]|uniref:TFIIF beta subunit N-terminal domain-containing protein n=1 Tax=Candolleomyces aberdarensis TaxID=2316362 RepID=A0A4Q2DL44_9AGAR|nr:hypothetical protein EST38_g5929 [Candolleomyces aberdarensis]
MERWAAVQEDDVHLATLRVYEPDPDDPDPKKKRKCFLFLPPNRDPINASVNVPSQPSSKARSSGFTPASTAGPISLVHPEVRDWPNFAPHPYDPIDKPYKKLPTIGRDEPDIFELEVYDTELENHIIVASREKKQTRGAPGYHPRARTSMVTARIKTRAFVKRVMSASYRRSLKERNKKAHAPRQLVKPD